MCWSTIACTTWRADTALSFTIGWSSASHSNPEFLFLKRPVCSVVQRLTTLCNRFGGMSSTVVGEGTHFKLPWLQRPYIYNVRSTPRNIKSITGSRDLQMIDINLRIIYRPQIDKLPEMYRTLGLDYDERFSRLLRVPTFCSPTLRLSFLSYATSVPRILACAALRLAACPRVRPGVAC